MTTILSLDLETYYDDEYSLKQMPTPNYILDSRFECIMAGAATDTKPVEIIDGPLFGDYLKQFDPANTITITFNSLFDNSILAWRYGFVPKLMIDVMGMARALRGHLLTSASLESVARHLGLGELAEKGSALLNVKGMHRQQIIDAGLWPQFSKYCGRDVQRMIKIFNILAPEFPQSEYRLMDLVLRCTVEPKFKMDVGLLVDHIENLQKQKAQLLVDAGLEDRTELMSSVKFKALLERLGVQVETKTNINGKEIPALAKTDKFMADLLEHENPFVQAAAAARLGFKSTIEETRCLKLLSIATQNWPILASGGNMPVPLAYGRAHTHRLAGEWKMNMQNMPTARSSKGKSRLRHSLVAPEG